MKSARFWSIVVVVTWAMVGLSGCTTSSFYHDYIMSGQVVTTDENTVRVCTADTRGVLPGQVVKVFRTEYDAEKITDGDWAYKRVYVGTIRIDKVKDKHFAEATVLSGDILRYDMVELQSQ